ncbi:hypothetical protein H2203_004322 [Taxawa tesnikishii (nom. ined.)]|nr:hypothetical protein H2203_004322 [Dothideales sp. JES 119]
MSLVPATPASFPYAGTTTMGVRDDPMVYDPATFDASLSPTRTSWFECFLYTLYSPSVTATTSNGNIENFIFHRFNDLPLELRTCIYYMVLIDDEEHDLARINLPALLLAGKQTMSEAAHIFYHNRYFSIRIDMKHNYDHVWKNPECYVDLFVPAEIYQKTLARAGLGLFSDIVLRRFRFEVYDSNNEVFVTLDGMRVAPVEDEMIDNFSDACATVTKSAHERPDFTGYTLQDLKALSAAVKIPTDSLTKSAAPAVDVNAFSNALTASNNTVDALAATLDATAAHMSNATATVDAATTALDAIVLAAATSGTAGEITNQSATSTD